MLAPTRELVSRLNQRAQDHRFAGATRGRQVELADGNAASVGDLIITRANDRRLRITATDWVKNGDRWIILSLTRTGGLTVRHAQNGPTATLPPRLRRNLCAARVRQHRAHCAGVSPPTPCMASSPVESRDSSSTPC
jgi:hypothetical protein